MTDLASEYGIGDDFFDYIEAHKNCDVSKILLSKKGKNNKFDLKFAALQIECRNRITGKLPEITKLKRFLFPSLLSTEQATCQSVAQFHSTLFKGKDDILDLTAGLGEDDFYIAPNVNTLTAIEIIPMTATVLEHNMNLYRQNVNVINDDAYNYLKLAKKQNLRYDAVFIDPARRDKHNKRIFGINDCEPNILNMLEDIKSVSDILYVKTSPMIDITQTISEIPLISDIWIIGVKNECKELLLRINFLAQQKNRIIHTINFYNDSDAWHLEYPMPYDNTPSKYCNKIHDYIYEPNCCIMKAMAFGELSNRYNSLFKIGKNSHLYTSDELLSTFPGRKFSVIETIPFKDKYIKGIDKIYPKANISTRNFKISAEEIKRKLKIQDGGDIYIFATMLNDSIPVLIISQRVQSFYEK